MQNLARHRATLPSLQTNGHNRGTCRFESVPTTVMTSGFRRLIARMLLAVFVFAQLATAAHACVSLGLNAASVSAGQRATAVAPSIPPGRVEQLIAAAANADRGHCGARGCNDADSAFSNICDAHCQSEQQRVDASPSIKVAPAVLLTTGYQIAPMDRGTVQRGLDWRWLAPPDAAVPPHTILHCCFRL
jgi:hypothetical protein